MSSQSNLTLNVVVVCVSMYLCVSHFDSMSGKTPLTQRPLTAFSNLTEPLLHRVAQASMPKPSCKLRTPLTSPPNPLPFCPPNPLPTFSPYCPLTSLMCSNQRVSSARSSGSLKTCQKQHGFETRPLIAHSVAATKCVWTS